MFGNAVAVAHDVGKPATSTVDFRSIEDPFIENWGTIADAFGMHRNTGRVHALVYLSSEHLTCESISERLRIEPGQCRRHLRQLCAWGVIHKIVAVDRDEVYDAERDPWTWFVRTLRERRHHEFVPVLLSVRNVTEFCEEKLQAAGPEDRHRMLVLHGRVKKFAAFFEELAQLIDTLSRLGKGPLFRSVKLAARWVR
ncbi:MAG: hypothetical protein OXR73_10750 [Myxococcales bacterium]|nr:hypothetical protein [Myxococcales bacterium]